MARPLIAIHTGSSVLYLSNFDSTTDYEVHNPVNLPAAPKRASVEEGLRYGSAMRGVPWRDVAERIIPLYALGSTPAAAEDAVTALQTAVDTHGAMLQWQRASTSRLLACEILSATVEHDAVDIVRAEAGKVPLVVRLVTTGAWHEYGAGVAYTASVSAPGTYTVNSVRGDRPAKHTVSLVSDAANGALAIGVKPSPAASYTPIDTYTTSYTLPASLPTDGTMADTPPALVASDNTGVSEVFVKATGPAASIRLRTRSISTGGGALGSVTASAYSEAATVTTAAASKWLRAGSATVPSCPLPVDNTGLAYAEEEVGLSYTTGTALTPSQYDGSSYRFFETIAIPSTVQVVGATIKGSGSGGVSADIYSVSGGLPSVKLATVGSASLPASAGEVRMGGGAGGPTLTAGTYALVVRGFGPASDRIYGDTAAGYGSGTGGYYNGSTWVAGWGAGNLDLYFKIHWRDPIPTGVSLGIQAAHTGTAGTLGMTKVARVPADDGCVGVGYAFSANQGVLIDASKPQQGTWLYLTNSSGDIAPLSPTWVIDRGLMRPRPGNNTFVVVGDGTVTVTGTYWPCYSTAAAGDV